jgi:cell division control protein 6
VLDEIDQLETRHQDVLYMTFGWPSLTKSRVILVGIANSLDLTERLLPKLKLKANISRQPMLFQFNPYTHQNVIDIVKHRMAEVT